MSIFLNGLYKNYDPPGGIDAASTIHFDPTAQDWATGLSFAAPQGFASADTFSSATAHTLNMPSDSGIPITGTDRGLWVSGTAYSRYDIVTDPTDGLRYVAKINNPTATTQPHSNLGSWVLTTWTGFSPRSLDAGYYGAVRRVGDATRWFTTELHAFGTSGSTQPVIAGTGQGLDGTVYWTRINTYKGAWTANTVYATGDYIFADGSYWRCTIGGTSDVAAPAWTGTIYGNTALDGVDIVWQRRYVDAGAWTALTTYGYRVVSGRLVTQGGNDVRASAVTLPDTSLLVTNAIKGTDGTTGATEPAWSAAAAGSFWEDGSLIWRFGTFAINDPSIQNERLILSGLKAPITDGKSVTIFNDATAATGRDVVLADKAVLDRTGVQNLPGTDKESGLGGSGGAAFDFGGANIRLAEGQSQIVYYKQATNTWSQNAPAGGQGGGAVALAIKDVLNTGERGHGPDVVIRVFDFTGDASYPALGYALAPSSFGLSIIFAVDVALATDGAVAVYDPTSGKLRFFWSSAAGSRLTEVTTGASLATTTVRGVIYGR